ncbi:MAG: hypothetical protein JXR76_05810 [Deltaproteobacteria bacterium]|nr:hypothetical protein [Deltaproteobacteria bacterium]
MTHGKSQPVVFGIALGYFATIAQILLMREFMAIPGLDELSLGAVLCAWLCYVAFGAFAGSWLNGRKSIVAVVLLCNLFMPASLLVVRHFELIFGVAPGEPPSPPVVGALCAMAAFPGAFASGFLFTSLSARFKQRHPKDVSRMYVSEGGGATLAGLTYTFVIADALKPVSAIWLATVVLSVVIPIASVAPTSVKKWWIPITALTGMLTWTIPKGDERSFQTAFETQASRGAFITCADSHYHRLCVSQHGRQFQFFRDGLVAYVFPDPYERPVPVHLALSQHQNPKRILVLGGGVPNRISAALQHHPERVTYLDFDPAEFSLLSRHFSKDTRAALQSPNVVHITGHNRTFLRAHPGEFDVILQFASAPLTAAENADHTVTFYHTIKDALANGGILAVITDGSANVMSPPAQQLLASRRRTLKSVFQKVLPVVDVSTFFFATQTGHLTTSPSVIRQRLTSRQKELAYSVYPEDIFSPLRLSRSRRSLSEIPGMLNVDDHPAAFLHTRELQKWIRESSLDESQLAQKGWRSAVNQWHKAAWSLGAGALVFAMVFWSVTRRSRIFPLEAVSIGTTGIAGLGLEIVLIYWFSVNHGGLYYHIAWLLAVFMSGLALGGWLGYRRVPQQRHLAMAEVAVIAVLGVSPALMTLPKPPLLLFAAMMIVSGGATGFAFPVFLKTLFRTKSSATAHLMAADHLGAALGAILVSTIWLPHLGLRWTCVLLLLFKVPLLIKYLTQPPQKTVE